MSRTEPSRLPQPGPSLELVTTMGELLPDGLVVVGGDQVVRFVNQEALRILGCEAAELMDRHLLVALPLTDRYGRDWWADTDPWGGIETRTGHREKLLVGPTGRELLVTARYVRGSRGGRVERVLLGLRDAEARQRAERDQATVLSTVAHELRAPLTSVTGFTSSLLRRWDRFTDEQKRLMIETIEADATRLTRLITELLDISRLDSDQLILRLGPVDLHAVLSRHVVRHELGRHPGAVRLRLGPRAEAQGLPELWADSDRLEQVVFNLIDNGLRHGSGVVTVTIDRSGRDWQQSHESDGSQRASGVEPPLRGPVTPDRDSTEQMVVMVDDEGDGIAVADREKIFGRFWHGPSNASTGLGLYVVRGLVEAHGGSVTAGVNEAGGARFVLRLPAGLPDVLAP